MLSSSLYPISQQGAISPAPSSKQVLADSATTQARRQSWRELACRRAYIVQLTGFSSPTKRKNSSRQTYITPKGAETGVIREGLANISNLYQIKHRFFSPSVVLSMHVLLSLDVSALRHDCLPTLEPGTKSRISARFMAQGGSSGGCSSGGGGRLPFSRRVCGVLVPRSSLETRGVPSSGPGHSQNGIFFGGWHWQHDPGRPSKFFLYFFFGSAEPESV